MVPIAPHPSPGQIMTGRTTGAEKKLVEMAPGKGSFLYPRGETETIDGRGEGAGGIRPRVPILRIAPPMGMET